MAANVASYRSPLGNLLSLLLIVLLLIGPFTPLLASPAQAAPKAGILQTVGDFLSLGANTVRELQKAITMAGAEIRSTLDQLNNDISTLMQTISQTYQDNLNVTLNSLDAVTRTKLLELEALITRVHETLQEDIALVSNAAKDVMRNAALQVRRVAADLEQSLKNVIIVGGETAAFVVDKAIYDAILLISLILLGLGLLLFIWLLFSRRLPGGLPGVLILVFMFAFLAAFGAMAFVPQARGFAMTFTGIGLEQRLDKVSNRPRILDVVPPTIILGQTKELEVWGTTLRPKSQQPTAKIAERNVPVNAASDQMVVLNVASLSAPEGSTNVVLSYPEQEDVREVVRLARLTPTPTPPDLVITSFTIDPASPVAKGNAHAAITVRNQGAGPARAFAVQWKPIASAVDHRTTNLAGLNPGESRSVSMDASYPNAGSFDSVVTVDLFNAVAETNEANNSTTRRVTVQAPPQRRARVTVTFTQITVHDDADPNIKGAGEIWLNFNISGQAGRFPTSGTKDMNGGSTYTINKSFQVTLTEVEKLVIYVNGTEDDDDSANDGMGEVRKEYVSANEWGKGAHSDRSSCPDGCYTIHYTVSVVWL
jgi:hypothetical protein